MFLLLESDRGSDKEKDRKGIIDLIIHQALSMFMTFCMDSSRTDMV